MIDFLKYRVPIRVRMTLWYVLLLAATFILFGVYLLFRFQNSLRSAIDGSLQVTVSHTVASFEMEDYIDANKLTLNLTEQPDVGNPEFAIRLLSAKDEVWDSSSNAQNVPSWGAVEAG